MTWWKKTLNGEHHTLFAASLNMLTCLHLVVLSKNLVLFSLAEFSVFVKHGFEYEKAPDALFFSFLQRFIRQVLFLPFEKADLSRPV